MTPRFAKAVDPLFLRAIRMLERIEQGAQLDIFEERAGLITAFQGAETALANNEDWKLAKYAIAAWIDEVMNFAAAADWEQHPLEYEFFGTTEAPSVFFQKAEQAQKFVLKDGLEAYYICVVLGFRGVYRSDPGDGSTLKQYSLPADIKVWARQVRSGLALRQGRPPIPVKPEPGESARPLRSKYQFLANGLTTLVLLLVLATLGWSYAAGKPGKSGPPAESDAEAKADPE